MMLIRGVSPLLVCLAGCAFASALGSEPISAGSSSLSRVLPGGSSEPSISHGQERLNSLVADAHLFHQGNTQVPLLAETSEAPSSVPANLSPKNGKPLPDLLYASIDDLQEGMAAGTFSAVDLVKAYLGRIAEANVVTHAIIETNPDALAIAAGLDGERANGTVRGPLHGIPIILKDNVGTLDKMNTTAGSYALLGAILPRDATIAAKLKAAGAIILAKANLSQWSGARSMNGTNGWTSRGGQTTGAYYPLQDPSGSSSGSGTAISIGLSAAAIGTETSGSIIGPSNTHSLTGIKPSVGLTSRYHIVPISSTQDTPGPMTRTMKDAAYILSCIAGKDEYDAHTTAQPWDKPPDYVSVCNKDGLKGAKIGIPRNAIEVTATNGPVIAAFNASIAKLKALGATITEDANFPDLAGYRNYSGLGFMTHGVAGADFVADIAKYFNGLTYNPNKIHSLAELKTFTETCPLEGYPDRNTAIWELAANLTFVQGDAEYNRSLEEQYYYGTNATILGALDAYDLDALVMPSIQSVGYAALAGYPIISVPLGYYPQSTNVTMNSRGTLATLAPNLPFGMAFLSRRFEEQKMVAMACAFEQATKYRLLKDPYFIPKVQLIDVM